MTVAIAFLCPDGAVIAADSMLTPVIGTGAGSIGVGHHTGRKVYVLPGEQIFGLAGDVALCARIRTLVEANPAAAGMQAPPPAPPGQRVQFPLPLDYGLLISEAINTQFEATKVPNRDSAQCFVAFPHGGRAHCCTFMSAVQPYMLDEDNYYAALGSGKLSADPFLRFLVDTFCPRRRPNVREAVLLATWVVRHTIDTASGGVAEPIRVAVLETADDGLKARELPEEEIQEHKQVIANAQDSLRGWLNDMQSGAAAEAEPAAEPPSAPNPA